MATSGTKIVIEINGNIQTTGENNIHNGAGTNTNQNISQGAKKDSNKTNEKSNLLLVKDAANIAKDTVIKSVEISINRNLSLTENYIGQQTLSNVKTIASKTASLIGSVATGAVAGGPIGAAIAAASWGIGQYFEYRQRMESYYRALNAANAQTEFSQTRAGLYNDGRGTLN